MVKPSPFQARVLRLLAEGFQFGSSMFDPREGRRRGGISMRLPEGIGSSTHNHHRRRKELNSPHGEVSMATVRAMLRKRMLTVRTEERQYGNSDPFTVYHLEPAERWLKWVSERAKPEDFDSIERPKPAFTEQQMLDLIKARYKDRRRYAFFRQFTLGTGMYANRRIDAFVMSLWPSDDFERIAFEVKVTRSDFLSELRDQDKRARAAKYANRFYFAAPAGMIAPEELPENVGLMEAKFRPNGEPYLRMAVRAKSTPTPDFPMWLVASIVRRVDRIEFDDVLQKRASILVNAYFPLQGLLDEDAPADRFKDVVTYWFTERGHSVFTRLDDETVAAYIERYNFLHAEDSESDSHDDT
jgi:hypothetical protein